MQVEQNAESLFTSGRTGDAFATLFGQTPKPRLEPTVILVDSKGVATYAALSEVKPDGVVFN